MSSPISIKPPWKAPAWLIAVLGVVGGWIVGLLTPVVQSAIEKRFAFKESRVALLTYAARDVRPTLQKLDAELSSYLDKRGPEIMRRVTQETFLNMASGDSLVYRILPANERSTYLKPFDDLNEELTKFNVAVGQNSRANAVAAARRAVPLVRDLLGVADRETPEEVAAKKKEIGK